MSFFKSLFKAIAVGTLVFMTGGAAAAWLAGNAIAWGTLAIQGAVLSGLSSVVGYLSRPKTDRKAANDRLNLTINPSAEAKFVFGETAAGTDVVYQEKIGDDRVFYVVANAWHEIDSFGSLYFNDEEITLDSNGISTGDWEGAVKVQYRTGTLTQDAIQETSAVWPPSAKGAGVAHMGMLFNLSAEKGQEKLGGGIPSRITQVIKGAKVYDPRLDSSIGGSGAHRVDDQSTWEFENDGKQLGGNWALVVAHYLVGYRQNGKLIYGVGVDPADIDWQQVADMATVCETLVDGKPKYQVAGIIPVTNNHESVIKQFEDAIDGKVAKIGGKYYIYAPHDDTADVKMVITDDDIIADSGVTFSPSAGLQSLFNTATGQYVSPENLYQFTPYNDVVEEQALADDGKARIVSYDFSMIQDAGIAERISRERIRRSRFTASMILAMGPKYIALKPFDVVQINIRETNNQPELFRVIRIVGSINGYAEVEFIEEDASIYDVSTPLGPALTQLNPNSYDPTQVITPVNLQATNVVVQGDSSAKDAIRVTWNNPGPFVEDSEIRYRVAGSDDDYTYTRTTSLNSAIIVPVEPLTEYEIEVRHITRELVLSDYVQILHTSGDETVNIIRQPQIDELVPNTPFASFIEGQVEDTNFRLNLLGETLGGVDALLEEVSQDISNEFETLEAKSEIRQVRIDNLTQVQSLVDEYLQELEGETLPELAGRLDAAEQEINELETVTLPALNTRLDSAEDDLTTLTATTIPQVQSELALVEIELDQLSGTLSPIAGALPITVDDVLEEMSQDIQEIVERSTGQRELGSLFPIQSTSISDDAIITPKIAANAIIGDKIAANAISADKIQANAITADKIQANAIDGKVINGLTINGAVINAGELNAIDITGTSTITGGTITGTTINSATINAGTLNAINIIGTSTISGATITGNDISGGTIDGAAITAGSIIGATIEGGIIKAETSIESASIGASTITGGTINSSELNTATINSSEINAATIVGANISGTVSISSPTITGGEIQGTNITATNTITGATLNGTEINTSTLNSNTITGGTINSLTANSLTINTSTLNASNINTSTLTGNTITGGTITGARQITTDSGVSVITDPGTTELTSDLIMWVGPSSATTLESRTRNNALFFIASDNKVSSNISGGRASGQLTATSNSAGTSVGTTRSFAMPSNRGLVELTGITGWVNITGGLSFNGFIGTLSMEFRLRNVTTGVVLARKRVPMTYNATTGTAQTTEQNLPFFGEDDLGSSDYGDSFVYQIEMEPTWTGTGSITGSWFTSNAAQITDPKIKAYQFVVTF